MAAEKPAPTENGRRQSTRKRLHEEKLTAGSSSSRETAPTQHEFINAVNWSRQDFEKIIDYVKTNGFYGDYKALLRELPHLTETSLRNLFQQLSRSTDFGNEQSFASSSSVPETLGSRKKSNKKSNMESGEEQNKKNRAPIEEWISLLIDHNETQRLGANLPLIIEYIAKFENHPDPQDCDGIDYSAIYSYIATLLKGHIPKQLNPASASKLCCMFSELTNIICQSASVSQKRFLENAKRPYYNPRRGGTDEKNQVLRERRRVIWTASEMEEAETIKSGDLQQIKNLHCAKTGLNPFHMPPTL